LLGLEDIPLYPSSPRSFMFRLVSHWRESFWISNIFSSI